MLLALAPARLPYGLPTVTGGRTHHEDEGEQRVPDRQGQKEDFEDGHRRGLLGVGPRKSRYSLGFSPDAFVAELDGAGSAIVAASFLGGSGTDFGRGIAVDGAGNTYVTGSTSSAAFPGVGGSSLQPSIGGSTDGFVVEIGSPAEVPAVSPWGLAAMAALLGGALSTRVRRRRQG